MTLLRRAAFVNVAAHALGLVCAALFLKPGTPLVPVDERMEWLAARPWQWTAGWAIWILCAVAMGVFVTLLGRALAPRGGVLVKIAIVAAWVAVAIDITCDTAWMTMPGRAAGAQTAAEIERFLAAERLLGALGQVGANGLYSLSVLLLSLALPGRLARLLGAATFLAGMGIVAAGVTNDAELLMLSTGPTIGLFCVWTAAAALVVAREIPPAAARRDAAA